MNTIGIIGLGKMGYNLAFNLNDKGYNVSGLDTSKDARDFVQKQGIRTHENLKDFINGLGEQKVVWVMLPSWEATENTLTELLEILTQGSIVIEGGNSNYKDSIRRGDMFYEANIGYLDCGTSGGTSGARNGACLMVGGKKDTFDQVEHIFESISGRDAYLYTGQCGSGHFLKMVHNGIEYGMMQAIGEGFHLLKESEFGYDLEKVAHVFNNGSVVRSWLMELAENLFKESPALSEYKDVVFASGEGQWTVEAALERNIAVPVIAMSVMLRSLSQDNDIFSNKMLAGLRNQFGGHSFERKSELS